MISHKNVIANTIQLSLFDQADRDNIAPRHRDIGLGLLPQSHIYSLIVICHVSTYRGDSVIVLPKFELEAYFKAIAKYKISTLYVVPPIAISMIKNLQTMRRYDLTAVRRVWVGAAPLAPEIATALLSHYPTWKVTLGYGMTETCGVVTSGTPRDIVPGSSGWLLPGFEVMLTDGSGAKITDYDKPGEVLVKSPSVMLGYLNNGTATRETFVDLPEGRFIKTGDLGLFRRVPSGAEHLWIVDRLKELIKVKVPRNPANVSYITETDWNTCVRAIKSRPRSSRPASLVMQVLQTVPSYRLRINAPEKFPRLSSCDLGISLRGSFTSMLKID